MFFTPGNLSELAQKLGVFHSFFVKDARLGKHLMEKLPTKSFVADVLGQIFCKEEQKDQLLL